MSTKQLKKILILKLVAMATLAHAQVFVSTIPKTELRRFENNILAKTSVYMQYEVRNISGLYPTILAGKWQKPLSIQS